MTLKQKLAVRKIVENHGNISKAMRAAGYDPTTVKNPKNLTESKGFLEAVNEYKSELLHRGINGARLSTKMEEWLEAQKRFTSHTEPDGYEPDYRTQLKAGEWLREDFGLTNNTAIIQQFNTDEMTLEFIGKE